jgi:hypothetical protein
MRLRIKLFFQGILSQLFDCLSRCPVCYDVTCYLYACELSTKKPVQSSLSLDQIYEQGGSLATRDLALAYGMYHLSSQKQALIKAKEVRLRHSDD